MPSFGEFFYDPSRWRPSIPFVEQLKAFQELVDEGKVISAYRYIVNVTYKKRKIYC